MKKYYLIQNVANGLCFDGRRFSAPATSDKAVRFPNGILAEWVASKWGAAINCRVVSLKLLRNP
jgi:hypothetical protein